MDRRNRAVVPVVILLLLAGCRANVRTSATTRASAGVASADVPRYLKPDVIDPIALLPNPPSADSLENEQEYATLTRLQQTRTDGDVARTKREATMDVFVFDTVLGPWFNAKNCPKTAALFAQIGTDARYFSNAAKSHWNRPRPTTRQAFVPMLSEPSASYPSGHSNRATCWAEILADIFPDRRGALLARGREIGFDRAVGGVHFPTDIYGGRVIGHAVAQKLLQNREFRADLAKVKAELEQRQSK